MHLRRIALVCPFLSARQVPELSTRSRRSIFPRFTLNHKYKSQERRESIEITARTLLFCFRVVEACRMCIHVYVCVYMYIYVCVPTYARVYRSECTDGMREEKPLPRTTDVPPVKSIFPPPPDVLFARSRRQKNFRFGTLQTD